MANVLTFTTTNSLPLFNVKATPFIREGCSCRGLWVDYLDGSSNPYISSGYNLGTSCLLSVDGSTLGTRASVKDNNGVWSEFSNPVACGAANFSPGSIEGSIGSGALNDLSIQSPGIVFPDFSNGSGRGSIRKTLVSAEFLNSTQAEMYPKGKASFSVKLESLDISQRQLLHRFFRALNGTKKPFFLDYVETSGGTRLTGVSRRYLVRFRDQYLSDSLFGGSFTETNFNLIEVGDLPSGGDNYNGTYSSVISSIAHPNYVDTYFQFYGSDWNSALGEVVWQQLGIAGQPGQLTVSSSTPSIQLYASKPVRANQRVGIQFISGGGVVLRYKDTSNYTIVYLNSGTLKSSEVIGGTPNVTTLASGLTIPTTGISMQVEVIGSRLRWWLDLFPELRDRPMDGALDVHALYDDVHYNNWGVYLQSTSSSIQRFIACELPGAVMPPPMITVALADSFDFTPVSLSIATTFSTTNQFVEWEVLPNDPADFPEPYRATTVTTSHIVYVRPGFNYLARCRLVQTPWSEYVPISVGSSGGSGFSSKAQYAQYWPSQEYSDSTPATAGLSFPAVVPSYVLEGKDESKTIITTVNMGKEYSATTERRPSRTFTLKFEEVEATSYQILIDFFEMCHGKKTPFNWVHPFSGETFVLRFNSDDYSRIDADTSSETASGISSVSFQVIECPPLGSVIPAYTFRMQLDPSILTNPSQTPLE